ncbi:hypothetical protein DL96DRAFT_1557644 [Flagelloscypha sp. PMI_526]|nr:hypothetical protein DL96DRAFT_1557644 [Flagelloscypha sp. PMI_526]
MSSTSDGGSVRILLGASGPSMHLKVEFSRLAGSYALAGTSSGWMVRISLGLLPVLSSRETQVRLRLLLILYGAALRSSSRQMMVAHETVKNRYFIIVNLTLQTLGLLVAPSNDLYFSSSFSLRNIDFSKGAAWVGHLAATGFLANYMGRGLNTFPEAKTWRYMGSQI